MKQWAYGSNRYTPSIDYTFLSRFIKDRAKLFDGYFAAKSRVALVHSWEGSRLYNRENNAIAQALEQHNVPFDLVVVGDEFFDVQPTAKLLESYESVIVSDNVYSWYFSDEPETKNLLDALGGKLLRWTEDSQPSRAEQLKSTLTTSLSVESGGINVDDTIQAHPRRAGPGAPYVVHLTRNDAPGDGTPAMKDIALRLEGDVFDGAIVEATVHRPDEPSKDLSLTLEGETTIISGIENLNLWAIVELKLAPPTCL